MADFQQYMITVKMANFQQYTIKVKTYIIINTTYLNIVRMLYTFKQCLRDASTVH